MRCRSPPSSASQGLVSYLLCWAALGVASTLALNTPASIALAQVAGARARQAIAVLAIVGGFASTVFWPLSGVLEPWVGWRGTLLIFAALHLLVCLPVHLLMLPGRPPAVPITTAPPPVAGMSAAESTRTFLLLAIAFSCGAFIFTGFIVHAIDVLRGLGHDPATALLLASLIGPAQVAVRLVELTFGHRYSIMSSALFAAAVLPLGLGLAWLAGGNLAIALLCLMAYGVANGLKAVLRATLPLALFGRAQFGTVMGRLALPQGIVSAVGAAGAGRRHGQLRRRGRAGALLRHCEHRLRRHDRPRPREPQGPVKAGLRHTKCPAKTRQLCRSVCRDSQSPSWIRDLICRRALQLGSTAGPNLGR